MRIALLRGRKRVDSGSARLRAGRSTVALARALGRRGLPAGSYKLELVAIDAAGNRSAVKRLGMRARR